MVGLPDLKNQTIPRAVMKGEDRVRSKAVLHLANGDMIFRFYWFNIIDCRGHKVVRERAAVVRIAKKAAVKEVPQRELTN
jgi:hypothetical protein